MEDVAVRCAACGKVLHQITPEEQAALRSGSLAVLRISACRRHHSGKSPFGNRGKWLGWEGVERDARGRPVIGALLDLDGKDVVRALATRRPGSALRVNPVAN